MLPEVTSSAADSRHIDRGPRLEPASPASHHLFADTYRHCTRDNTLARRNDPGLRAAQIETLGPVFLGRAVPEAKLLFTGAILLATRLFRLIGSYRVWHLVTPPFRDSCSAGRGGSTSLRTKKGAMNTTRPRLARFVLDNALLLSPVSHV